MNGTTTKRTPSRRHTTTRTGRHRMRHKSRICQKGYRKGQPNPNKGKRFYADTYSREEILALVDGCNCGPSGLRDRALIVLLWRTGLRISEALGLRLHDVNFDKGTIRVRGTKTRTSDRTVGIDAMTAAHVRDWLDVRQSIGIPPTGFIFCCISRHERGNPVKPAQTRQKLHRLAEKAGISKRVHPHGWRHTLACDLVRYIDHLNPTAVLAVMAARE